MKCDSIINIILLILFAFLLYESFRMGKASHDDGSAQNTDGTQSLPQVGDTYKIVDKLDTSTLLNKISRASQKPNWLNLLENDVNDLYEQSQEILGKQFHQQNNNVDPDNDVSGNTDKHRHKHRHKHGNRHVHNSDIDHINSKFKEGKDANIVNSDSDNDDTQNIDKNSMFSQLMNDMDASNVKVISKLDNISKIVNEIQTGNDANSGSKNLTFGVGGSCIKSNFDNGIFEHLNQDECNEIATNQGITFNQTNRNESQPAGCFQYNINGSTSLVYNKFDNINKFFLQDTNGGDITPSIDANDYIRFCKKLN